MSGHSKWATIKHKKGAIDAKRGAVFTKAAKMITIAAKEGGGDPESNFKLRLAIEKARSVNMPKDNIARAIGKGTGEIKGATIEPLKIEAYAAGGAAFIVEAITDNKNRTLGEIRNIITRHGGKMAESGSVAFQFDKIGIIRISDKIELAKKEEIELAAIDAGASDLKSSDETIEIFTKPEELEGVKNNLKNVKIDSAEIELVPKNRVELSPADKAKIEKLFEELGNHEDVNEIYSTTN